ncbi:MAG: stage V sporulation protein AA [Lachnospiraceae bacterium]|nr:stage V sporulation protein AA [Lachnospiraceae bacterium]
MVETLYLKLALSTEVEGKKVTLRQVAELECANRAITNRLGTLEIFHMPDTKQTRFVVSVIDIFAKIHEIYPNLIINSIGETDIVIKMKSSKREHPLWQTTKIVFICLIVFCGAAFAIMGFNNDVSAQDMFMRIYALISGKESDGTNIVHIMYSVGLTIGILVFYNHFGNKKLSTDPTPIQIELNNYEGEINRTIIEEQDLCG